MRKLLLTAFIVSACGPSGSGGGSPPPSTPVDLPVNPKPTPTVPLTPTPIPGKRYHYKPSWLSAEWTKDTFFVGEGEPGAYGIFPGQEPIADSLFRYWEGIRSTWTTSLHHGVIPTSYLNDLPSGPENIVWIDKTGGTIPGFEKLKPVLDVMWKRCPSLAAKEYQAPLQVYWATENQTIRSGQYFEKWVALTWDTQVRIDANTNLRPTINVRAEYTKKLADGTITGYSFPNQTFKEITGGKSYADGGYTWKSIDETFAHEYGHYLFETWALNTGRSNLQSRWFAEGFADLFRTICWGGIQDNLSWVNNEIKIMTKNGRPFDRLEKDYRVSDHRFSRGNEYSLDSLGDLIAWEVYNQRFEPDLFLQAMFIAAGKMKGRKIADYPVSSPIDGVLTDSAPWANAQAYSSLAIQKDVPVLNTRSEFVEHFCSSYASVGKSCGEVEFLLKADSEGLLRDEW